MFNFLTRGTEHKWIIFKNLGNEDWYRLTACLNFGIFNDLKRFQTPHSLFTDLEADKTSTTRWSGSRVQVWVQLQAPACHLAITPEGVDCRNQWQSSWGRDLAQLGRVGRASTNTGRFWVDGSRCEPRPARLRKKCYHSSDANLLW